MSEENMGIVRRVMNAWNRQDVEGILALADPEVEYASTPLQPLSLEPGEVMMDLPLLPERSGRAL